MKQSSITEKEKITQVAEEADVVVCGAGPAGIAAALTASQNGAKTILLESNGCLGGVWTSGLLVWIVDAGNKGGVMETITRKLEAAGAKRGQKKSDDKHKYAYDVEVMKYLLESMASDAGVLTQIHTRVVAIEKNNENAVNYVITESKSGRQAWKAKVVIDTTGDGDVGALAGCRFHIGHPQSGKVQPMTLMALVSGLDAEELAPFIGGGQKNPKEKLLQEIRRAGVEPSYQLPVMFQVHPELYALAATHIYNIPAYDAQKITQATVQARREIYQICDGLKKLGGVWKNLYIVATAEHIGVREGRRIVGLYEVTTEDALQGKTHEDAVCKVTAPFDVHSTDFKQSDAFDHPREFRARPYDIPLRALIAKDVDGLMMAGRCISGDFLAHSSYRVTGNAVAMGEAAGKAAALAVQKRISPRELVVEKEMLSC